MSQADPARALVKIAVCLLPLKQLVLLLSLAKSRSVLLPRPLSNLTYLFLHTSSNTYAGICGSALEVRHPGMILEFSVFKAMPLIDIIIMFFHYYLVSAH